MSISKIARLWIAAGFVAAPALAQATPLKVVTVAAPDVNCVFDPSCKLTVTDTVDDIVIPGMTARPFCSRAPSAARRARPATA